MKFSRRVLELKPSATLALNQKAKDIAAEGKKILNFTAGEPDFSTPSYICEAAIEAMKNGDTKYTPVGGTMALKNAILHRAKEDLNLSYSPSEVLVSSGGKQSLYNLFMAILEEGDEVIILSPYWVSYPDMVRLAEATPVIVHATVQDGFVPNIQSIQNAITDRTKLLILNSPSNPTGAVYPKTFFQSLSDLMKNHENLHIVSDEIYERLIFPPGEFYSPISFFPHKDRVFIVNGVSKSYAMTGWRIGYTLADASVISMMSKIQAQSTSCASSISQAAAAAALCSDQTAAEEMRRTFERRRTLILEQASKIPNLRFSPPLGAFYFFPDFSYFLEGNRGRFSSSAELAEVLLVEYGVATVPGEEFGAPNHLRFTYSVSDDQIIEGFTQVKKCLESNS